METTTIQCPRCNCPNKTSDLTTVINFPDDVELIFSLIENNINMVVCSLCKFEYTLDTGIAIISLTAKKMTAVVYNEKQKEEIITTVKGKFEVTFVDKYENAAKNIVTWLNNDLNALIKVVNNQEGESDILTALQIRLLLSLTTEKYMFPLTIQPDFTNPKREDIFKNIYRQTVSKTILGLLGKAQTEKAALDFPNRMRSQLPVSCVTDDLLNYFIRSCEIANKKQIQNITDAMAVWNIQYINASLHSLVSRDNPQKQKFAWLIRNLWEANAIESGLGTGNQYLLLDKQLAPSFLTFESFFDVHIQKIKEAFKSHQPNLIEEIRKAMDFYDWGDKFSQALAERIIIRTDKISEQAERNKLVEEIYNSLSSQLPSAGEYNSENIGIKAAASVSIFFNEQFDIATASALIDRFLETIDWKQNRNLGLWICIECTKALNKYGQFEKSEQLLSIFNDRCKPIQKDEFIPADLLFNFYIESGNTCRYTTKFNEALELYNEAEGLLTERGIYKDERKNEATLLLKRNKAIIKRQLGDFASSLELFKQVREKLPNDFQVALNIQTLYMQTNLVAEASEILEPFYNRQKLGPKDFRSCGLALIASYGILEKYKEAKEIIITIYKDWHTMSLFDKVQLTNVCLYIEGNNLDFLLPELDIEKLAFEVINNIEDYIQDSMYLTTLSYLLRKYLFQQKIDQARELFYQHGHWLTDLSSASWEYYFVLALYYYNIENYDLTKACIQKLITDLNDTTPKKENKAFTIRWMQKKDTEQKKLLSIVCDLFDKGCLSEMEVLEFVELSSGREIAAKLLTQDIFPYCQTLMSDIASSNPHANFFIFFDVEEEVRLIHISISQNKITIEKTPYKFQELEQLRIKTVLALNTANPGMLGYTDKQLKDFVKLTHELGNLISKYLDQTTEEVYFVTGRSLANLPLHLVKISKDEYIIEKYPICYINNLATLSLLSKTVSPGKGSNALITAVTKENDKADYVDNIRSAVDSITKSLRLLNYNTKILHQSNASKINVVQELNKIAEVVFLCHGITGREEDGGGICLAYNNTLPPGVNDAIVLKDFLFTWQDIEPAGRTPPVFISAACSSAVLKIGRGGVNFGLEQSLFANGTKVIISPLWNVHQQSALYWLKDFFQSRVKNPNFKLSAHYQYACLKTKENYPHFYFWAPFVIKGINNY